MQVKLKDIRPNPFRNIEHYPIQKDKVEALKASIKLTGFWDNLVAREGEAGVEIAYGHHRLAALRELYSGSKEIGVIIRPLDDSNMLRIMAAENMEDWSTSFQVTLETVRAVIKAQSEGKIRLKDGKTPAVGVAEFLGWVDPSGKPQERVYDALALIDIEKAGYLSEDSFEGLTNHAAHVLITKARRMKTKWKYGNEEIKQAIDDRASGIRLGLAIDEFTADLGRTEKIVREKDVEERVAELIQHISAILASEDNPYRKGVEECIRNRDKMKRVQVKKLMISLANLAKRAYGFAVKLASDDESMTTKLLSEGGYDEEHRLIQ